MKSTDTVANWMSRGRGKPGAQGILTYGADNR